MVRPFHVYSFTFSTLTLGCNLVLDIQEASIDPRLVAPTDAGAETSERLSPSNPTGPTKDTSSSHDEEERDGGSNPGATGVWDGGFEDTDESTSSPASPQAPPSGDTETSNGGDSTEPTLCERYCGEVMENCKGDLEQYRDLRQCLTVCALYPEGELLSDANDNTIACRLRYASNARYAGGVELAAYCRQAGPGGDDRCGSNCEGYCTLMEGVCTPEEAGIYRFESRAACLDACQALPRSSVSYSTSNFELSDGNHVQCRLFHVTSAAMLDAEEHCEHAMGLTLCEDVGP